MENSLFARAAIHLIQRDTRRIEGRLRSLCNALRSAHGRCRFVGCDLKQGGRMALDSDQHMTRIELPDIHESQRQFILEHTHSR